MTEPTVRIELTPDEIDLLDFVLYTPGLSSKENLTMGRGPEHYERLDRLLYEIRIKVRKAWRRDPTAPWR